LSALSTLETSNVPLVGQGPSGSASFGILSTYPPTPCGLATFSAALSEGLCANGSDVSVVRVADGSLSSDARVIGELVNGSAASVAATSELLNECDIAVVQHEYGVYGGVDGDEVVDGSSARWVCCTTSRSLRRKAFQTVPACLHRRPAMLTDSLGGR
jgi:hypothetical protein